jgi:hypothetical protein
LRASREGTAKAGVPMNMIDITCGDDDKSRKDWPILARDPSATRGSHSRYTDAMRSSKPKRSRMSMGAALVATTMTLLATGCGGGNGEARPASSDSVIILTATPGPATALPRKTPEPTPSTTATPLEVCASNPDPAPPKVLQIQEPHPQQQVQIPFHIRGWGSNIGANNRGVALGIVDNKQSVVQVLNLPPQPNTYRLPPPDLERTENSRPFAADIVITGVKEPTPYFLWIYLETTPEGRPRGVVQVPVVVVP